MIVRRTIERVTDREGRFLHDIWRTSRRPYVNIVNNCPPFEEAKATFEVEVKPGRAEHYIRRIE